ncbi:unnamed protein product, partial [Vitis vinifera]
MAEIAVTTVIDKLVSLVDEEARLLGGVHTQVEDIKTELLYIQAFLKDADAKADKGDISHGLKTWIQDLRKTAYSMEDLIDEYLLHFANPNHRHRFFGFLCKVARSIQKLKPRHEIASKIRDIKKKVGKLKETSSSYVFISSIEPRSSSSSAKGNPKRTVISVVGMGGLGKTTFAKKVYDNQRVVGHFDCNAWVTVYVGSRIIITTRNDEVASSCKESSFDYIHKLQPLSPKSSWELFCKKTFQGGCPPELEKLSLDISCFLYLAIFPEDYTIKFHNSTNNILDTIDKNSHVRSIFLFNSEMIFTSTLASKCKLVKFLSLRKTKVKMLPKSIGKLQNLQTLDLKHSLVEELPVEINRLQKLRHILAYNYNFDVEFSSVSVKGLRQLRKLGITKLTRENGQPLSQLPNLLELELLQTHAVEQLCFEAIGFQKLKVLRICDLIELKKVKIENGALPQVEELEIGPSPQLEEVPHGIYYLRKLKTLAFRDMQEEFELSMIPYRGRNYDIVEHIPNVFFYQRLSGQHYAVQSLRQLAETIPRVYC